MSSADNRLQAIRKVLRESRLPVGFVNHILNPDNNPAKFQYHNSLHCQTVAYNCILAANETMLNDDQKLELVVASLFHDWNHSGGKHSDDVNIQRAEHAYMQMHYRYKLLLDPRTIVSLIRATYFPHKQVSTLQEQVIQDADLLQYAFDDCSEWVYNFNQETKAHYSNSDVASWMKSQHYNTAWGKKMMENAINKLAQ